MFHIKYWALPDGARIKTTGEFNLPARDNEDAIDACECRWPDMVITEIEEIGLPE